MQEKTLVRIALITTLIGLMILYFYSQEISLKPIQSLDDTPNDQYVKMSGTIDRLTAKNQALFLQITGEKVETTNVIVFPTEELYLKVGDNVEISGKVTEYQGKKEIIGSKIVIK